MARIPAGSSPVPEPAPEATPSAITDDVLAQVARDNLGLDYASLGEADQQFVHALASGQLDSFTGSADPDNPLIPGADDAVATPLDGVDGGGVGPVTDAPTEEGAAGVEQPAPAAPESVLPAAVPFLPELQTPDADDPIIDLGGGLTIPTSELRSRLAQQNAPQFTDDELRMIQLQRAGLLGTSLIDPATGLPITPAPIPQQPGQPQPTFPQQYPQQYPQPQLQQPEEWVDAQAQAAYQTIQQQLDQIAGNQRQQAQAIINQQNIAIGSGLEAGIALFQEQRGTNDVETDRVMRQVNALGSLPQFAAMYPGDASRAIAAAMDSAYWNNPDFREREMQKLIATRDATVQPIQDKKALAGGIVTTPGTVSRTPPPAVTREQRDQGMVAEIETALREGR